MKKCSFTGHRPKSLPWGYNENSNSCIEFKNELNKLIERLLKAGYSYFIVGMAEGFDTYVCEALLNKQAEGYNIYIEGAIPCPEQDAKWHESSKKRYQMLLTKLDKQTIINYKYTPTCMQERNDYMLKNSNLLVACYNKGFGGTLSTIKKAQKQGKDLIIINPQTLLVTETLSML